MDASASTVDAEVGDRRLDAKLAWKRFNRSSTISLCHDLNVDLARCAGVSTEKPISAPRARSARAPCSTGLSNLGDDVAPYSGICSVLCNTSVGARRSTAVFALRRMLQHGSRISACSSLASGLVRRPACSRALRAHRSRDRPGYGGAACATAAPYRAPTCQQLAQAVIHAVYKRVNLSSSVIARSFVAITFQPTSSGGLTGADMRKLVSGRPTAIT